MNNIKIATGIKYLTLCFSLLLLVSCSKVVTHLSLPSQTKAEKQLHTVSFQVNPSLISNAFNLKQVANPNYLKLTIKTGTQTIYAVEADSDGFVALNPGLQSLTAEIPTASNLVATLDYCENKSLNTSIIKTLKTAFHSPPSAPITMDITTSLKGSIVEQLQVLQSSKLNTPYNLDALQDFTNQLTGLQMLPQINFSRLVPPNFPSNANSQFIDAHAIARAIDQDSLIPNSTTGTSENPQNYRLTPFIDGHYLFNTSNPLTQPIVFGNANQVLYHNYKGTNDNAALIAIDTSTQNANHQFPNQFNVQTGGPDTLFNIEGGLSVGYFGQTYLMQHNPNDQTHILRSFELSDGSQDWSYWFGYVNQAEITDFTPVVQTVNLPTGCLCDDKDIVYTALNANATGPTGKRGIYAVDAKFGTIDWFYNSNTDKFRGSGALSPNGDTLYVVSFSQSNTAKLIALNTANGQERWVKALNHSITPNSSPTIGHQGQIYIATYNGTQGYLSKIETDGSTLVNTPINGIPQHSPVIDFLNGQEIIYISTDQSWLYAINGDQSMKWSNPLKLKGQALSTPLIGEDNNSRTLYLSTSSGQVCAIKDKGNVGEELWRKTPGGKPSGDLNLKDNYLYVPTSDGNDFSQIAVRRLKVSTPNLPASAPWPKRYGNVRNTGRRPMDLAHY